MRASYFQPRKTVERTVIDQLRQEKGRLKRISDDIAEVAASFKRVLLHDAVGIGRMEEHRDIQLFGLAPERIIFRARRHFAHDRTDGGAADAEILHRIIELFCGEIRVLERGRSEADETIRMRLAP